VTPYSPVVRDLNEDGKPDIVVASVEDNAVTVLLGHGNGSFTARRDYATGNYPESAAVADFNGNGKPDFAVGNLASSSVTVFTLGANLSGFELTASLRTVLTLLELRCLPLCRWVPASTCRRAGMGQRRRKLEERSLHYGGLALRGQLERRATRSPAAWGTLMYAMLQARRCIRNAVCASSVTVSTAMPPISFRLFVAAPRTSRKRNVHSTSH